jgi:nucleoside transporter
MMFLQYFTMGAIMPIMSLYLKDCLHYSGSQVGMVLAMSALAAFVSPVIGAVIADRLISAERLLTICHLLAAVAILVLLHVQQFVWVLLVYLVYSVSRGPSVALTNSITFHHHPDGQGHFGNVRVWGTIGWIVVAWAFGYVWLNQWGRGPSMDQIPDALKLSALSSLVLGFYALTLPRVPHLTSHRPKHIFPVDALRLVLQPRILLLAGLALLIGTVDRYYYFGMAPYLRHLGFSDAAIMPTMSVGQMTEVFAMFGLSTLLARIGFKYVLVIGLLAELWRFATLAWAGPAWLTLSGVACHGIAYPCVFTAIYIYIDGHCNKQSRTGLHQLFALLTWGLGSLIANLLAGTCLDMFVTKAEVPDYFTFWLIPGLISFVCLVAIGLVFKNDAVAAVQREQRDPPNT